MKRLLWIVVCLGSLGCSKEEEPPAGEPVVPGPPEWNREVTPPSDAEAESTRAACGYRAGALPAETQGASHPDGANIPVDHIVVAMMENRSFDHYFQKLRETTGADVDVAPDDFSNPDPDGQPVTIFHDTLGCFVDTPHGWNAVHEQIGDGAMAGFVTTAEGSHELPAGGSLEMLSGRRAMGYYLEEDLPLYYWIARNFAIGDRHFSSVAGSTWPNRMYLFAASSFGRKGNDFPEGVENTIFDHLDKRQIPWKFYHAATPTFAIIVDKYFELSGVPGRFVPIDQFYADAAAGALPPVSFIDPDGTSDPAHRHSDEHPPALADVGQNWLGKAIEALVNGPQWERSALFITYDEHGGLYDHVVPPAACPPDDLPPDDTPAGTAFDHLGVRVPLLVVSPFAKPGYVGHRTYDHTSITRFIEARFVMPALSDRDANAEAPWDMFDFAAAPNLERKPVPVPPIREDKLAACDAIWN
jgi:phospholipase C